VTEATPYSSFEIQKDVGSCCAMMISWWTGQNLGSGFKVGMTVLFWLDFGWFKAFMDLVGVQDLVQIE
jgi:hypothetical protein